MLGGGVGQTVLKLVEEWNPSQEYDHERKYQSELQDFLDENLNQSGGGTGFGLDMGGGQEHSVYTERGTSRGDVVVDDVVGIELKRNFSNSQKRKLKGQLSDYGKNYDFVIACACGIDDNDGWIEVKNEFANQQQGLMDMTEYHFVSKKRENFGTGGQSGGDGGILGGGGFF